MSTGRRLMYKIKLPFIKVRLEYEYLLYAIDLANKVGMDREVFDNEFEVHAGYNFALGRTYVRADSANKQRNFK